MKKAAKQPEIPPEIIGLIIRRMEEIENEIKAEIQIIENAKNKVINLESEYKKIADYTKGESPMKCFYCGEESKYMESKNMCSYCANKRRNKYKAFKICCICGEEKQPEEMQNSSNCKVCWERVQNEIKEAEQEEEFIKVPKRKAKNNDELDRIAVDNKKKRMSYGEWQKQETLRLMREGKL